MKNQFQNACLLAIVVLLSIIAFRPHEKTVSAGPVTKYQVLGVVHEITVEQLEKNLNAEAKDGWAFDGSIQNSQGTLLVFKK